MNSIEELKKKLRNYIGKDITFNEPHFTQQLILREGSREEVINNLLNPEKLVYYYKERGKQGNEVYCLYFRISNTRTMKLPVILDKNNKKGLYIKTYIMRYRAWQSMIRGRKK